MSDEKQPLLVVGAGLGGMAAAIAAAELGFQVTLLEAGDKAGGAAAYSGGQVWVGGNHVAAREGLEDDAEATLAYIHAAASRDEASVDSALAEQWVHAAAEAARWFEQRGVIRWEVIPDYPDYYYPDLPGSRPRGRYLTGAPFDATGLGADRPKLRVSPHFPVGVTYGEMFGWGGMSSRTEWNFKLIERRREAGIVTFGTGIAGAFLKGVLDRGVDLRLSHRVAELLRDGDEVVGVRCEDGIEFEGPVVLATGAHDWATAMTAEVTGIPTADGGSVAPDSIRGDGIGLATAVGAATAALPGWAAPVLPGYRVPEARFEGDSRYRACFEHCLPHTFLVNDRGERFCDDSFHSRIVAAALAKDRRGEPANLPIYMVWDSEHHERYGLGATMPGGDYPDGLVRSAASLAGLAAQFDLPAEALAATAERFNEAAGDGVDLEFGRGTNLSVRRFRGDGNQEPNPCVGAVGRPPFYGMRIHLLSTGIAAVGVCAGSHGRVLDAEGTAIPGLWAAGECAARAAAGVGYNSGYSLSRAMAYGFLAAHDVAASRVLPAA